MKEQRENKDLRAVFEALYGRKKRSDETMVGGCHIDKEYDDDLYDDDDADCWCD